MKTKHIISIIGVLVASAMLFSCKNPATEIVEFDPTYGLDPAKTNVEKPTPMDYNPNNIVIVNSGANTTVQLSYDAKTDAVKGDGQFEVSLRMRRALDKDLTVNFVLDRSLLSEYQETQIGFVDFPSGIVENFSMVIKAGKTVATQVVRLKDITALKKMPGYLTAFKMQLPADAPKDLIASAVGNKVFLKVKVVEASSLKLISTAPAGSAMPYFDVFPTSNFRNDGVWAISDGRYSPAHNLYSWWVENKSNTWLTLELRDANPVTGFVIYNLDSGGKSKTIKSVRIEVSNDKGQTYTDFGLLELPDVRRSFGIEFEKPMDINMVRFSQFDGYSTDPGDPWIDIHEIRVFHQD